MAGAGRVSIDIVIPSIRLDTEGLLKSLRMEVPPGVDLRYYVISDNRNLQSGEFEHNGIPVRVVVNAENLGAPLSRNVGLDAGTGRYVLFIDDDVAVPPDILYSYLAAIREEPDAPGYVGPTAFPDPVNSFTRGIRASDMLTFFTLPAARRHMSWGTTSNLMVRRGAVGDTRFSEAFPKHGGGEDIDFCLRVVSKSGGLFRAVPGAQVRHPWWRGAGRSYARFFRWAVGDSRLVLLHPRYMYRDVPGMVETLVFGAAALGSVTLASGAVPPAAVGIWAGLVVCLEFAVEQARARVNHPGISVRDALESAAIRLSNELGKFLGPLGRRDASCLFKRFDYFVTGESIPFERKISRTKFALFSISVPLSYWLGSLWGLA